ncbi:hypothetical protein [Mycoplasma seminis]|uniref:DUF5671 domain-containing protein n=1 Tax=Mycoplasma seminis TaxID=512749 RepID=A0ABY9HBL1_9MOLU|nr:hypothetical protein [Mycoplasma seminis]WLP85574.1 hypothetical protein Q8852_00145 [Mycoplasma seminis]
MTYLIIINSTNKFNISISDDLYQNNLFKFITFSVLLVLLSIAAVVGVYFISAYLSLYYIEKVPAIYPLPPIEELLSGGDIALATLYDCLILYPWSLISLICLNRMIQYGNNLKRDLKVKKPIWKIVIHTITTIVSIAMLSIVAAIKKDVVDKNGIEAIMLLVAIFGVTAGISLFNLIKSITNKKLKNNTITNKTTYKLKYLISIVTAIIITVTALGYFYYATMNIYVIDALKLEYKNIQKDLIGFYFLIMFVAFASSWMYSIYSKLRYEEAIKLMLN